MKGNGVLFILGMWPEKLFCGELIVDEMGQLTRFVGYMLPLAHF
jgi:hypothetical protein